MAQLDLQSHSEMARIIVDNSHDMIFVVDMDSFEIVFANQTAIDELGYSLEQMREVGIDGLRKPLEQGQEFSDHLEKLEQNRSVTDYANVQRRDGSLFPVEANTALVEEGAKRYNVAIVRDISDRVDAQQRLRELNRSLEQEVEKQTASLQKNVAFLKSYQRVVDASSIVSKSDINGKITYANDNFCKLTGYSKEEVIGKPHSIVRHPDTNPEVFKDLWTTIKAKKIWKGILKNRKKDGSHYWVDIVIMPILDENSEIDEFIAVRHDITELVDNRKNLERLATTDTLTGYGNRFKLLEDIKAGTDPAVALIDIDSFNEINDFYGSEFGDEVIKHFATAIYSRLQQTPYRFYHLHGDQCAVLADGAEKGEFIGIIKDLNKQLSSLTFEISQKAISLQTTASISFENKDNLTATADMARKYAKKHRMHFITYSDELHINREYENNIKWTMALKNAFYDDRIVPFYQGIYNNKTQTIEKYECLVRMIDENGKVVSPFFFLDVAKRSKQYITLTKRMIDKAFSYFSGTELSFSINLSLEDIESKLLRQHLFERIERYGVASQLVVELVESEGVNEDNQTVSRFIEDMRNLGVQIAIDDFGTGYSNFAYLIRLNANFVKIDGSMIKNIDRDTDAQEIVKTIIDFAKKRNLQTVAEFVSSREVFDTVCDLGIDYSQGFFIHKPSPEIAQ